MATSKPSNDAVANLSFAPDTLINLRPNLGGDFLPSAGGTELGPLSEMQLGNKPAAVSAIKKPSFKLPLIGKYAPAIQIRVLTLLALLFIALAAILAVIDALSFGTSALQVEAAGDTLTHSQRIAKASFGAMQGEKTAFDQLKDSRAKLGSNLHALSEGGEFEGRHLDAVGDNSKKAVEEALKLWANTEASSALLIQNEPALMAYGKQLDTINNAARPLQEEAQQVAALKLQMGSSGADIASSGELSMLTQRISKSATELTQGRSLSSEAAFSLGKDIVAFKDISAKILAGIDPKKPQAEELKKTLGLMAQNFTAMSDGASGILNNVAKIRAAKIAEQTIYDDNEALKKQLEVVQKSFAKDREQRNIYLWVAGISGLLGLLMAACIAKVIVDESRTRGQDAEAQMLKAKAEESDTKLVNEKNQNAILRLMNELQEVADGNLTVQATVSEDVTGAIADSVNYTVEELRALIGRINVTAEGVSNATGKARQTTSMLLKLSEQQSAEIQVTGDRVLDMARNITDVSNRADSSSAVAQRALSASRTGLTAVQASLQGMNGIRDQIQDTAKRIKRLGESSQQISEIVDLIGDITEQTNVLALNASIQAASAGEAGRGFTVVAEEVQRLAERSGEATKQISALVRAIQTDTQDAVSAMERSTHGVVEGAKLADAAGVAITDISKISQELAEIILDIANTTRGQVDQAQTVAQAITQILSVTERTTAGTRETSQSTEELAKLALELKKSVARFKVTA
jgi:twitching motility protein PilJ